MLLRFSLGDGVFINWEGKSCAKGRFKDEQEQYCSSGHVEFLSSRKLGKFGNI